MRNYIIFDLEWNQSPKGKTGRVEHLPFEIIEIGAVKLDEAFRLQSEFHRLIRPQVYTQMHSVIFEVTHMSMEELQRTGEAFDAVAREFLDWCGSDYIFCTWGSMDLMELQRNMSYYNVDTPWELPLFYYDVQKLYSLIHGDGKQKSALDVAVEELHIKSDRPFHRALDDAYYTGKVMEAMGLERVKEYISVDYYNLPALSNEEIHLIFPDYHKYVSRVFSNREAIMKDRKVTELRCVVCGRSLRKKIRWFTPNQKIYYALGLCPEHGLIKGKIRVKKSEDGDAFVIKTTKLTDQGGEADIRIRKEAVKKRREQKKKGLLQK